MRTVTWKRKGKKVGRRGKKKRKKLDVRKEGFFFGEGGCDKTQNKNVGRWQERDTNGKHNHASPFLPHPNPFV